MIMSSEICNANALAAKKSLTNRYGCGYGRRCGYGGESRGGDPLASAV